MRSTFVVGRFFCVFWMGDLMRFGGRERVAAHHLGWRCERKIPFRAGASHFFDFIDRPWRAFRGRLAKKVAFFCAKNLQGINSCLIFASPNKKWWIHLRARIRASHARHRGSNPLSTTKETKNIRSANRTPLFFIHSEAVRAIRPQSKTVKNRAKYRPILEKSSARGW